MVPVGFLKSAVSRSGPPQFNFYQDMPIMNVQDHRRLSKPIAKTGTFTLAGMAGAKH
jgi:hypothetical protein